MTQPIIRPLSFGEILDGAFTLYRRNFLRFLGTTLLVLVGAVVLGGILVVTGANVAALMPGFMQLLVGGIMGTALFALTTVFWGALIWQAARAYEGKPRPVGESLETAGGAAMTMLGAVIVSFMGIAGATLGVAYVGTLLAGFITEAGAPGAGVAVQVLAAAGAGIAGLLAASYFAAVLPVVIMEEKGPLDAVVRSVRLMRGAALRTLLILVTAHLITLLPSVAIAVFSGGLVALTAEGADLTTAAIVALLVQQLASVVVAMLTAPFIPTVLVLLYYDRRVRTEALDVEIATGQLQLAGA